MLRYQVELQKAQYFRRYWTVSFPRIETATLALKRELQTFFKPLRQQIVHNDVPSHKVWLQKVYLLLEMEKPVIFLRSQAFPVDVMLNNEWSPWGLLCYS